MKTYSNQVHEHLAFLQSHGFDVNHLEFGKSIRCHSFDHIEGRGNLSYRSMQNEMSKGYVGIITNCRDLTGARHEYKTYGLGSNGTATSPISAPIVQSAKINQEREHEESARRAYGFWQRSSTQGISDYLIRKQVSSYGLRFRNSEKYGQVAVVPMRDENNWFWSYQLLNPDGTKRMPEGARTRGLFHILKDPIDGETIGIAEGYATAATCLELSDISVVCCFSSSNMQDVVCVFRKKYPKSRIILFADNDRHLESKGLPNEGILRAQETVSLLKRDVLIKVPDFGDIEPSKNASDWNDLMLLHGKEYAKKQILYL